jgi:hypothetical protein
MLFLIVSDIALLAGFWENLSEEAMFKHKV